MIPGSNILKTALSVITPQTVMYHRYQGRTTQINGVDVASYAPAVTINGSFQPVPRRLYQQYGLDFNNNYSTFYTVSPLLDVQRDSSGDQIVFCGKRFQVLSNNDWMKIDGWNGVLCVQIAGIDAG